MEYGFGANVQKILGTVKRLQETYRLESRPQAIRSSDRSVAPHFEKSRNVRQDDVTGWFNGNFGLADWLILGCCRCGRTKRRVKPFGRECN